MYHSIHSEFIETPLLEILKEGLHACRPLVGGIQTEPVKEYFLSSLFLRMTGAQEQKLKCVCWELATHDYAFRRDFLVSVGNPRSYGEFSSLEQKERVYNDLLRQICSLNNGTVPSSCTCLHKYKQFSVRVCREAGSLLRREPLCYWLQKEKQDLRNDRAVISPQCGPSFKGKKGFRLLQGDLRAIYEPVVEAHRHRCAHNLTSIQNHLPSLSVLRDQNYPRHNYAYRFLILILIDEIFMELYKEYKRLVNMSPWR